MAKELSPNSKAYNAAVEAINDADRRIDGAAFDRDGAWEAAQALNPLGKHGAKRLPRRIVIVKGEIKAA